MPRRIARLLANGNAIGFDRFGPAAGTMQRFGPGERRSGPFRIERQPALLKSA
jgi:hypothetical protein